jgi:hypothetical protein
MTALKIHFKEQALLVGTEQSREANKAVGPLPALFCARYYRLLFQLDFVLIHLAQSTLHNYQWAKHNKHAYFLEWDI